MDYRQLIIPFLDSLNLKTERNAIRYREYLQAGIDFLERRGLDVNAQTSYTALKEALLARGLADTTAQNRVSITQRFFAWINTRKEGDNMTENISFPLEADALHEGGMSDSATQEEKRKPGRPIKGKEERDKKITVNIPGSIWTAIQDISRIDGVTFPDTVNSFLEEAVNARYEDIEALRMLRAKKH